MKSTGKRDNQIVVVNGRPQVVKTIDRAEAMEKAEMFVVRNLPKYLKKMHELALGGFYVQKTDQKGNLKVYTALPDRAAIEYLIERGLGKIPQRHEITGEGGGPLEVLPWAPASLLNQGFIDGEAKDVSEESEDEEAEDGAEGAEAGSEEGAEEELPEDEGT